MLHGSDGQALLRAGTGSRNARRGAMWSGVSHFARRPHLTADGEVCDFEV